MFCRKCGAEIPEGAHFCEKCGNPIQGTAKRNKKKRIIFGGCIGVIIVTGALYVTGVFGGNEEAVQADADTVVSTEMPDVTEKAVGETEGQGGQKNQSVADNSMEDKAYKAYIAYKTFVEQDYNEYLEDYEYEEEDGEYSSPLSWEEYDQYSDYVLIYLDGDDYPELVEYQSGASVENKRLYTYDGQTGVVVDTGFQGTDISYLRKKGYLYDACRHSPNWSLDYMIELNHGKVSELFSESYENGEKGAYTRRQVAKKANVSYLDESEWSTPEFFSTLDEAYTDLLKENK